MNERKDSSLNMKAKTAALIIIAAAVGTADVLAARSVYLKKKATVLCDMALMSIDEALRTKPEMTDTDALVIPIE